MQHSRLARKEWIFFSGNVTRLLLYTCGKNSFDFYLILSTKQLILDKLLKKQESFRRISTSTLLTMSKPLTVWITKILWKILKEMGIPDHLTCLLRNMYAGQEATVRIGHGTTDWFQIRKGVHLGCILFHVQF